MSSVLTDLRRRFDEAAGADRARLAVEIAEHEPVLGHRAAVVRAAIAQAGQALDDAPDPELEARVLLRLGSVAMAETDLDGADAALTAAGEKVGRAGPLMYLSAIRSCRVAIRRGDRATAAATLRGAAGHLASVDGDDPPWRRVLVELALGIAEVAVHEDDSDADAFDPLTDLVRSLGDDAAWVDEVFTARQLLVVDALARDDAARAALLLREVVKVSQAHASPEDEVEARIARAAALMTRGDRAAVEEAEKVIQIARDRALEHGLEGLHVAALIAQAGVMDARGKTHGALDRCLEIARLGAAGGDVRRYVAAVGLMSTIYQRHRDYPSAYRTIAESYHALAATTGGDVKPLFTPLLETLRDVMGADKFARMVDDVNRAGRLATTLESRSPTP